MAYSTVQRVALASGLVLAVSLLLPKAFLSRGKRQEPPPAPEGKLGRFPPMMHHQQAPSAGHSPGARFQRSHLAEAFAKAKGSGGGSGGGAFKGENHCRRSEMLYYHSWKQPQENYRAQTMTPDQEKRLLHQLREITRVMKEGKFSDKPTPEKEAEEAPYMEDWEGYPEETYPIYDLSDCVRHRQETILVDYPEPEEPSAEEIAERMGVLEEEAGLVDWEMPIDPTAQGAHSVTSCDPKPETCACCFHEEEDPTVLAENAGFSTDNCSEPEEPTRGLWPQAFSGAGLGISTDEACTSGTLRQRNPQGVE
ncbi:protein RIC-3 isoform X5 [Manis javanica]|uniref:protein RIC-3 isoform X5 n=2 Tax=Manis javanica TaxID=9974 RepID=UPI003C6CE622